MLKDHINIRQNVLQFRDIGRLSLLRKTLLVFYNFRTVKDIQTNIGTEDIHMDKHHTSEYKATKLIKSGYVQIISTTNYIKCNMALDIIKSQPFVYKAFNYEQCLNLFQYRYCLGEKLTELFWPTYMLAAKNNTV